MGRGTEARCIELASEVEEFEGYLSAHSEREERGMFLFLERAFPSEFGEAARQLKEEHASYAAHVAQLRGALDARQPARAAALLAARQRLLLEHFQLEEAACVPLLLELTPAQHAAFQRLAFGQGPGGAGGDAVPAGALRSAEEAIWRGAGAGHSLRGAGAAGGSTGGESGQPSQPATRTHHAAAAGGRCHGALHLGTSAAGRNRRRHGDRASDRSRARQRPAHRG